MEFTYTYGYYFDRKVSSAADSKCEAGAKGKKAPSNDFDPLYITVPLGFKVPAMKMECPDGLVCVDHPGTIDLNRLEPALKLLYPDLTDAQLTAALKNFRTPGHQHFITTKAGGTPESGRTSASSVSPTQRSTPRSGSTPRRASCSRRSRPDAPPRSSRPTCSCSSA